MDRTPRRLLIVDDDPSVRALLSDLCRETWRVRTAGTCAQAEALMVAEPAEAVILDYRLPDGTGTALLDRLAAIRNGLPALLVTGDPAQALTHPPAGPARFLRQLTKPVALKDLREALKALHAALPAAGD